MYLSSLSYAKQLRRTVFTLPLAIIGCTAFVVLRPRFSLTLTSSASASLLEQIVDLLKASSLSPRLAYGLGDVLGLLLLGGVTTYASSFLSLVKGAVRDFPAFVKNVKEGGFALIKDLPVVKKELDKECAKAELGFEKDLKTESRKIGVQLSVLPSKGLAHADILNLMREQTRKENVKWEQGKVSGAVYHGIKEHQDLLNEAFGLYSIANPLHPDIWPSAMKFEAEIVAMTASLVNADGAITSLCGCTSSGGTESIILAIKAHRDFYCQKYNIKNPEMIACTSCHAAVDKACDLMSIKLIRVPMDPNTYKMDLFAVRRAIGPNTIMMYASAPSYPQGVIDPIQELGALAVHHDIGLHVDCCLGGFVLPFAKRLGFKVAEFDFSVAGVSSMSLDTHKFGYALKGASVVLYRTKELRQAQYFCYADWTGGLYTTPSLAGSRSAGLISQCWASLVAMGEEGYLMHTKSIWETTARIATGIRSIAGIKLIGEAEAMIVCFASDASVKGLNVYSVADGMSARGWSLNSLQNPPCVHLCVTVRHVGHEKEFLDDLSASVEEVKEAIKSGAPLSGKAAIYGMTSGLPAGPVNSLLRVYNDVVLKL